jgi:hypothetical protein
VPGVIPAVKAGNDIRLLGKQVNYFTLSFIAPLQANNRSY